MQMQMAGGIAKYQDSVLSRYEAEEGKRGRGGLARGAQRSAMLRRSSASTGRASRHVVRHTPASIYKARNNKDTVHIKHSTIRT